MTKFDDNLWREVQRKYGAELSQAPGPLRRRSRRRMPVIAGTSLGVVGASVAAVIVLSAASSSPAFAVTPHADGTVSVVIHRIGGITGANRRLAQLGIRARAVRVVDGCQVLPPRALSKLAVATLTQTRRVVAMSRANGQLKARFKPAQIPNGRTLVIAAMPSGTTVRLVHGRAVRGAVPGCLPPTVQVLAASGKGSARGQVITCRPGVLQHPPRPISPGSATNTTATNSTPSPATATQTAAGAATPTQKTGTGITAATGTTTAPGTATVATNTTGSGTTTSGAATSSSPPSRAVQGRVAPPFIQACVKAARTAAGR